MAARLSLEQKAARAQLAKARRSALESQPPLLSLQPPVRRGPPPTFTPSTDTVLVAACAGTLPALSMWELSRRCRSGGAGWIR